MDHHDLFETSKARTLIDQLTTANTTTGTLSPGVIILGELIVKHSEIWRSKQKGILSR
jgi:hypothetical protein